MADTRIYNVRLYYYGVSYNLLWNVENSLEETVSVQIGYSTDDRNWNIFTYQSGLSDTLGANGYTCSISTSQVPANSKIKMRIAYKKNASSTAIDTYSNWSNILVTGSTDYAPGAGYITVGSASTGLYANEFPGIIPTLGPGRCPSSSQTLYAFDPAYLGTSAPLKASVTGIIPSGTQFTGVSLFYRGVDREGKYNIIMGTSSGGWYLLGTYTNMTPTYGSSNTFTIAVNSTQIASILNNIEQGETIQFGASFQYANGGSKTVPLKNLIQSGGCTTIWKNAVTSDVGQPNIFTSSTESKSAKTYIYYDSKWQITGAAPPTNYFHPDAIARNANLKQKYAIYLPALDLIEGKYYYLLDGAVQATCYNQEGTVWTKNGKNTTTSNTTSSTYFMHTSESTSANGFTYREAYPWLVLRLTTTSGETETTILGYRPRIYASS